MNKSEREILESQIKERYSKVQDSSTERARRLFVAAEARAAGHGGIAAAARVTGMAPGAIGRGLKELESYGESWWREMGTLAYREASSLLLTADGGGSNGYRLRLWKVELQTCVDELGFPISVCHLPPGTSKWNKIEHRLFSFIT